VSPEELSVIIESASREGALTSGQARLLGRALDFRELRAGDAMVPRTHVVAVPGDATCDDLRRLAVETGHSRFPVIGDGLDDVRGVVQAKDLLTVPTQQRPSTPVSQLAGRSLAVPESAQLGPLLAAMRAARSPLAIVVDEYGGTAGIVTLEDLVEELFGEIRDEYDRGEPAVLALGGGSFRVPGSWRLDEVQRDTGVQLPPGDYDTVSGLVMDRLGRVPEPGDDLDLDGVRLVVESLDGRAVGWARLERLSPGEQTDAP
jgi:CBS domain containing-hemolysin-like protein